MTPKILKQNKNLGKILSVYAAILCPDSSFLFNELFLNVFFRHYQKGLRSDPEHSELKKAYFGLKNLLKKTKSVSMISSYEA